MRLWEIEGKRHTPYIKPMKHITAVKSQISKDLDKARAFTKHKANQAKKIQTVLPGITPDQADDVADKIERK